FFQAEDGIRDFHVTGVQTCALPIFGSLKKILNILQSNPVKFLIIGDGSNTLFSKDFEGLVLKMNIKGKEIIEENDEYVLFKVGAGESWHEFVEYCVNRNLAGNENLAYIPGTVGAAPIQNIA